MAFPDEEAKVKSGPIPFYEKEEVLRRLGIIAQNKYDEFIVSGGQAKGYDLRKLRGSLQFVGNMNTFENEYWLEGKDEHWTNIAYYFEYGTGLYNTRRAGKYRAGYIKPVIKEYMKFVTKDGKFITTKKVKGVHPIFAMEKAIKYIQFNRKRLQREIRLDLQQNYDFEEE